MYQAQFFATNDADWGQAIELINDTTSRALDEATDASFALRVSDRSDSTVLEASTAAGTITKPEDNIAQWQFTAAQMSALDPGTYTVGFTMTVDEGTLQLLVGKLVVEDGGF